MIGFNKDYCRGFALFLCFGFASVGFAQPLTLCQKVETVANAREQAEVLAEILKADFFPAELIKQLIAVREKKDPTQTFERREVDILALLSESAPSRVLSNEEINQLALDLTSKNKFENRAEEICLAALQKSFEVKLKNIENAITQETIQNIEAERGQTPSSLSERAESIAYLLKKDPYVKKIALNDEGLQTLSNA